MIVDEITYLGFPIGDRKRIEMYWDTKCKKTLKAFYSLNQLGCKPLGIQPVSMARIYRIFYQPIFYGLEMIFISKNNLKNYDKEQSVLIKRNLKLTKFDRNSLLMY